MIWVRPSTPGYPVGTSFRDYARGLKALLRPWSLEPVDRTVSCLRTKPSLHEMQGEIDS